MTEHVDTNKVFRQHLEMEEFFAGFVVKGRNDVPTEQAGSSEDLVVEMPKTAEPAENAETDN